MTSGTRASGVLVAGTELSEVLLPKASTPASAEMRANARTSIVILFASSELSSIQRILKARSLPVADLAVVPDPVGLPLVADVSVGVVITATNLEGIILVRVLISAAGKMVLVPLVSTCEMVLVGIKVLAEVWVLKACVSKVMWLGTEASVRLVIWKAPSEPVPSRRVAAGASAWFPATAEPGRLVLEPADAAASQQKKKRGRVSSQKEPILAEAPATIAQQTCPLPVTATFSCFLDSGRRAGSLPRCDW